MSQNGDAAPIGGPLQRDSPYRKAFRRHRVLLALPPLVAMALALWFVLGTPKQYEAGTSVWLDNPPPALSSITPASDPTGIVTPPSGQAQVVLNELLATRSFRAEVGSSGPLERYLSTHKDGGWGPMQLLTRWRGSGTLSDRVTNALGPKQVGSRIVGPQVLAVTVRSPSATVAVGTLRALIAAFGIQRAAVLTDQNTASLAYYRQQAASARAALADAQKKLLAYVGSHPGATPCGPTKSATSTTCDYNLTTLLDSRKTLGATLVTATSEVDHASTTLAAGPAATPKIRVLDAPHVQPVSGMKKKVLGALAGLFGGLIVSLLALVALASTEVRQLSAAAVRRYDEPRERPLAERPPTVQPWPEAARPAPPAPTRAKGWLGKLRG